MKWYKEKRKKTIEALGGMCVSCGSKENLQIDHIRPLRWSNRGSNRRAKSWEDVTNIQLLCKRCHQKKTDKEANQCKHIQCQKTSRTITITNTQCLDCGRIISVETE